MRYHEAKIINTVGYAQVSGASVVSFGPGEALDTNGVSFNAVVICGGFPGGNPAFVLAWGKDAAPTDPASVSPGSTMVTRAQETFHQFPFGTSGYMLIPFADDMKYLKFLGSSPVPWTVNLVNVTGV